MPMVQHSIEVHIYFFCLQLHPCPQFIAENLQAIVCKSRLILLHPIPLNSIKITFIFPRQREGNSPSIHIYDVIISH
jgi:hypothetical protein